MLLGLLCHCRMDGPYQSKQEEKESKKKGRKKKKKLPTHRFPGRSAEPPAELPTRTMMEMRRRKKRSAKVRVC